MTSRCSTAAATTVFIADGKRQAGSRGAAPDQAIARCRLPGFDPSASLHWFTTGTRIEQAMTMRESPIGICPVPQPGTANDA